MSLEELLKKNNIEIDIEWNTDKPVRNGSQWFVGKKWQMGDKEFAKAWFGDYKRDVKKEWASNEKLTKEEAQFAEKFTNDVLEQERMERQKLTEETAPILEKEFASFHTTGITPYMTRKQITSLFGTRIKDNEKGDPILIVPLRDVKGKFWNYQRIYAQKLSKGDKFFSEGALIDGCFHLLGDETFPEFTGKNPQAPIYICEGFATAASIKQALAQDKAGVVCAFNAGNLQHVASAIKHASPANPIIVLADNDAYTLVNNKPDNVGIRKGRNAAGSVGGTLQYPVFKYPQKGLTDYNDLQCAEGLETVRDQILHFEKYVLGIQPMCLPTTKNGKIIPPTEKQLTEYLLKELRGKIVQQDKAIFEYKGTHWEELDGEGVNGLKQKIQTCANGLLTIKEIENHYKYFLVYCPHVPRGVSMGLPNPNAANFKDKTLHFWREANGKYHTEFRPHDPSDFLTSTLPFNAPRWQKGDSLPPAPMFDELVESYWRDNPDKAEVKEFVYQLLGAMLAPAFPIMVFFYGRSDSGKSTIIKLLVKLVQKQNVSNVQPCDFFGFNMGVMVGKLVNYDTDIDTKRPINDTEVKKIIDRMPRTIKRKFKSDLEAYLPAVHLFASNALPKTLDGASKAYGKRLTLIPMNSFVPPEGAARDFEDKILASEMDGLLARALFGLHSLLENEGNFKKLDSSREHVATMEDASDFLGQFITQIKEGEIHDKNNFLILEPEGKIERKVVWEIFRSWQSESLRPHQQMGKIEFYSALESRGFKVITTNGVRYFKGLGHKIQIDPIG